MSAEDFPEDLQTDELRRIGEFIQAADADVAQIRNSAQYAVSLAKSLGCEAGDTQKIQIVQRARRLAFQAMGVNFTQYEQAVTSFGVTTYDNSTVYETDAIAREFVEMTPRLELEFEETRPFLCFTNQYPEPNIAQSAFCITALYLHGWLESKAAEEARKVTHAKDIPVFKKITSTLDFSELDIDSVQATEEAAALADSTTPEGRPVVLGAEDMRLLRRQAHFIETNGETFNLLLLQSKVRDLLTRSMYPTGAGRPELLKTTNAMLERFRYDPSPELTRICHQARCIAYLLADEDIEILGPGVDSYQQTVADLEENGDWYENEDKAYAYVSAEGSMLAKLKACLELQQFKEQNKEMLAFTFACITLKQIADYKAFQQGESERAAARIKAEKEQAEFDTVAEELLEPLKLGDSVADEMENWLKFIAEEPPTQNEA